VSFQYTNTSWSFKLEQGSTAAFMLEQGSTAALQSSSSVLAKFLQGFRPKPEGVGISSIPQHTDGPMGLFRKEPP
jgi:hypothetical protein